MSRLSLLTGVLVVSFAAPAPVSPTRQGAAAGRIPTGQWPLGILLAPDGSRAYVAINTDHC